MKSFVNIFLLVLGAFIRCQAQEMDSNLKHPRVGQQCPDFVFNDLQHYTRNIAHVSDFKGKWLILDLWNAGCSGCLVSMPEQNQLQKQFQGKVQFMLIGYTGSIHNYPKYPDYASIHELYNSVQKKFNLSLVAAFDSVIFDQFDVTGCPCVLIIDPAGILRAITAPLHADEIADLLSGKMPSLRSYYPVRGYNYKMPFLAYGNGGDDTSFIFRSILSRWKSSMPKFVPGISIDVAAKLNGAPSCARFELLGAGLKELYEYAYIGKSMGINYTDSLYGKFWNGLILETPDSFAFHVDKKSWEKDCITGDNFYCYSLTVPLSRSGKDDLMKMMQADLKRYFGYNVSIETRKMPYWRLVILNDSVRKRLQPKTNVSSMKRFPNLGFTATGYPIRNLIGYMGYGFWNEPAFVNETGIDGKIDITIHALANDFTELKRALRDNGMDLIMGEKEMKVVVIR